MPIRPCIFCARTGAQSLKDTMLLRGSYSSALQRAQRLAIPVFRMRVSPVLDTCTRVLLIDLHGGREIAREEIQVSASSLIARVDLLRSRDVDLLICAGISQQLDKLLREAGIEPITGIAGDIEQVVTGFAKGRLNHPSFRMPGLVEAS
jgi:predicted Fe-Mo cluster-binding NifX family protein